MNVLASVRNPVSYKVAASLFIKFDGGHTLN
jgi:hypothetical protein